MKIGSSFEAWKQVWYMRRIYNEDQSHCYTRGKVKSTRKCTASKASLHRTYGAVHDARDIHEGCQQWPSLLTSGSHWEPARRAGKTPPSTAATDHCRVLGGWQGFIKKHLFPWPWSSSLTEMTNSMAREARKVLCEAPLQSLQCKTTTCCSRQLPCM